MTDWLRHFVSVLDHARAADVETDLFIPFRKVHLNSSELGWQKQAAVSNDISNLLKLRELQLKPGLRRDHVSKKIPSLA